MKYHFTTEIPIVRPSRWDPEELTKAVRGLSAKYHKGNILFGFELNSNTPRLDPAADRLITDAGWREDLLFFGRWHVEGWNFDPGTSAHVYLRRGGGGDAPPYVGRIEYVKGGKILGFTAIAGGRALLDYYRDMKKLGIYIP